MLTEERFFKIVEIVNRNRTATVQEIAKELGVSESTIRRDLTELDARGKLNKVHGGATTMERSSVYYARADKNLETRTGTQTFEKSEIGAYAAGLIRAGDLVYIDAGTTTAAMAERITETKACYVTNSPQIALNLAKRGINATLTGGEVKALTNACIGQMAVDVIGRYNFSIGFFGTNGISRTAAFSTPDQNEAAVKSAAFTRCNKRYVLADNTKFNKISPITFADFENVLVVTDRCPDEYLGICEIVELTAEVGK